MKKKNLSPLGTMALVVALTISLTGCAFLGSVAESICAAPSEQEAQLEALRLKFAAAGILYANVADLLRAFGVGELDQLEEEVVDLVGSAELENLPAIVAALRAFCPTPQLTAGASGPAERVVMLFDDGSRWEP